MATLGEVIKKARNARGWSQQYLATKAGIHLSTIGRIEQNRPPEPDRGTLKSIAEVLGLPFDEDANELYPPEAQFTDGRKGPGVPMVGDLNGGSFGETVHAQHVDGDNELPLPLEWFPGCVAARVRGTSMRPKYDQGDWVVLRAMNCEDVETGHECYFELAGGDNLGGTLKKVVVLNGEKLLLLPINDGEHPPRPVSCADVVMVRRAVGKYVPFVPNFGFDARARQ